MKTPAILGLFAAFGSSYLLAGLFAPAKVTGTAPVPTVTGATPAMKATKSGPPRIAPEELLATMDSVPMSSMDRYLLRSELYEQWAESDPLGMLTSFNGKALPECAALETAFQALAATQPAELLRYAREQGCSEALRPLFAHGDPRQNLAFLLERCAHSYPAEVYTRLFTEGEQFDPEFHRRISELPDAAARTTAFSAAAKIMIESVRYDDYFALLDEHPEAAAPDEVADNFATIVAADPSRIDRFDMLPTEAQPQVIEKLVSSLDDFEDEGQAVQALLPEYARRGWLEGLHDEVLEAILGDADDEDAIKSPHNASWKEWALNLPAGEACDYLRQAGIARWAIGELDNEDSYDLLPTPTLQDAARIGAAMILADREDYSRAKAMAARLHNATRRQQMMAAMEALEQGESVGDFDPFAQE